jgi:IS1 family transposase
MSNMNKLPTAKRIAVVAALVEGNSLRATARMTGVARMTIEKLLRDLGRACAQYQNETLVKLDCRRIQCDEIWSFCYAKKKNVTEEVARKHPDAGDVWTWTAIDADSKLIVSWLVGNRDLPSAWTFMQDVASRLKHRVQLTTDAHRPYLNAVEDAFGSNVDYAMLQKLYGQDGESEKRYSPAECVGVECRIMQGDPDPAHISTSYVERQNLTMRMHMRRFTRLTNAFSKKVEMHAHAVALHFMHYNFVRIHKTLRQTPAMAAGVTSKLWEVADVVALLPDEVDS